MRKILILSLMLGFAAVGTEAQEASSKQEAVSLAATTARNYSEPRKPCASRA